MARTYLLNKEDNFEACIDMVCRCWQAKEKQLYTVTLEQYDPECTTQQKRMYFGMHHELANLVNESKKYLTKFKGKDFHEMFAPVCPFWGMESRYKLDGTEYQVLRSASDLSKVEMIGSIDYLFKWAQEEHGIYIEAYDDFKTAQGENT